MTRGRDCRATASNLQHDIAGLARTNNFSETGNRNRAGDRISSEHRSLDRRRPERMDELHRIQAMANYVGMTPEIVSGDEVTARVPGISADGVHGALTLKEDGQVNPVDLTMAYAKGERIRGVEIREGISVAQPLQEGGSAT